MSDEHHQETPKQERAREAKEERAREAEPKEQPVAPEEQAEVEPLAITPGTAIASTTTIDALFAALFATRSADLVAAGTPIYSWGSGNQIIAQWPSLQVGASPAVPNYSAMWATFHARSDLARGSSIAQ